MARDSNRPLFHRFANREAINIRASIGGKRLNDGNNVNVFSGELALNNPLGTYWPDLAQAGDLTITPGADKEIGGFDRVKITASGDAIDLDAGYTWINISGAIDTTIGAMNIIEAKLVSDTEIEYRVIN